MNTHDIEQLVDAELATSRVSLNAVSFVSAGPTPPEVRAWLNAAVDGKDLTGAYLGAATLDHASLLGASLKGADLEGADLDDAYLAAASMNRVHAGDVSLLGADLGKANMNHARLVGAQLRGADMRGVTMPSATLDGADFHGASARRAKFNGVDLTESSFANAKLDDALFDRASLAGADLHGASLANARLKLDPKSRDAVAAYISSEWMTGAVDEEQLRLILRMWEGSQQGLHWAPVVFPSGRRVFKTWTDRGWGLLSSPDFVFLRQQDGSWVRVVASSFLNDLEERRATAEYLGVDPATWFNSAFWRFPVTLVYQAGNRAAAIRSGLKAAQLDRRRGPHVLELTRYDANEDASAVLVNTFEMARDGYMPFITAAEDDLEQVALQAVRHNLGMSENTVTPAVYLLHGDVPAKYLS